jgi:hypothetical protein
VTGQPWTAETMEIVQQAIMTPWKVLPASDDDESTSHHGARAVLAVLTDAGMFTVLPGGDDQGRIAQLVGLYALRIDQIRAATTSAHRHLYLSTACWHAPETGREDLHRECAIDTHRYDGSHKTAATCKWCPSRCVCACHTSQVFEELTGWHGQPVREMPNPGSPQEAPFQGSPQPVDGLTGPGGTPVVGPARDRPMR